MKVLDLSCGDGDDGVAEARWGECWAWNIARNLVGEAKRARRRIRPVWLKGMRRNLSGLKVKADLAIGITWRDVAPKKPFEINPEEMTRVTQPSRRGW